MTSSRTPNTPKNSKIDIDSPFREDKFQACSTPFTRNDKKYKLFDENLSAVREVCEDISSDGFSKSNNVTIIEVPEEDKSQSDNIDQSIVLNSLDKSENKKMCENDIPKFKQNDCEMNNNDLAGKKGDTFGTMSSQIHTSNKENNETITENSGKNICLPLNFIHKDAKNTCNSDSTIHKSEGTNYLGSVDVKTTNISDKASACTNNATNISSQNQSDIPFKCDTLTQINREVDLKIENIVHLDLINAAGPSSITGGKRSVTPEIQLINEPSSSKEKMPGVHMNDNEKKDQITISSKNTNISIDEPKNFEGNKEYAEISKKELNVTVTEDDVYFSKRDEVSIHFDTVKRDTLNINLEETFSDNALKAGTCTAKIDTLDSESTSKKISEIQNKVSGESHPPPSKRPRITYKESQNERPLEIFVSNNSNENSDNNNPNWKNYATLTNDELRYECVRKIWKNEGIPNANQNMSTYSWRTNNQLPPYHFFKNNINTYNIAQGGDARAILNKARVNAKYLFEIKVNSLLDERNRLYDEADAKLDYQVSRTDPAWTPHFYNEHRNEMDNISADFNTHLDTLSKGLEQRLFDLDKAEKEISTVINFYKGLHKGSKYHISPRELSCWFEREDTLNKYELYYA